MVRKLEPGNEGGLRRLVIELPAKSRFYEQVIYVKFFSS